MARSKDIGHVARNTPSRSLHAVRLGDAWDMEALEEARLWHRFDVRLHRVFADDRLTNLFHNRQCVTYSKVKTNRLWLRKSPEFGLLSKRQYPPSPLLV